MKEKIANLYIGTSGYDYKEWQGSFYPETVKQANFLSYYATQFNSLELNGTYYKMPTPAQMLNMVARTEGKVKFTIKVFQGITHAPDKTHYQTLATEIKKAIEPLQSSDLLLCALLQFPESFHYEKRRANLFRPYPQRIFRHSHSSRNAKQQMAKRPSI
jgi:uncharacterized protein YecE (DUF72 family)